MFPTIYAIETILGCNLQCPECAVGAKLIKRKYGYMSFDIFKEISKKIEDYCKYAYLHIWGEPMLNPDIIKIINLASHYTKTNISTNGNIIDKDLAKKLIYSGVSDIIVSIDGISQKVYSAYRKGGNIEKALKSLIYLVEYRSISGLDISISPQFIVFDHNKHEMAQFKNFVNDLGLNPVFKAPYLRNNSLFKNSGISTYERVNNKKICNINNVCTILLDGSVVPCCYDHNSQVIFGNIFNEDIEDIWNSKKFKIFRQSINNIQLPAFCRTNCLL